MSPRAALLPPHPAASRLSSSGADLSPGQVKEPPNSPERERGEGAAAEAVPHPLKAWRERQRLIDPASPSGRNWTVSDAARHYSKHIGREVGPHTWRRWELAREDPESRIPSYDDMIGLRGFTGGAVTADSFYPAPVAASEEEGGG